MCRNGKVFIVTFVRLDASTPPELEVDVQVFASKESARLHVGNIVEEVFDDEDMDTGNLIEDAFTNEGMEFEHMGESYNIKVEKKAVG